MSQLQTPINGGTSIVSTDLLQGVPRTSVLSPQFIAVSGLQARDTEWASGRPIYNRLPSVSQKYRIDFEADGDIGYVYIPYGEGIEGPTSAQVVASPSKQDLLIKAGAITWKYGTTEVLPAIVNLPTLNIESGKFLVAYQMIFDDAPKDFQYSVNDFILSGQPLNVVSDTDAVPGWRFPPSNAFLSDASKWSAYDARFPSFTVTNPGISWSSEKPQAYSSLKLQCPENTAFTGSATLYYLNEQFNVLTLVQTASVSKSSNRQYFEFQIESPSFQYGWKVVWTDPKISIESVTVSGVITQLEKQYAPSTRAALVMFPENQVPKTTINSQGEEIPATYCNLAYVDINDQYEVLNVRDVRMIIHQSYVPVSDWLTLPFDENLKDLQFQVENYAELWMSPVNCMNQEYASLTKDNITVNK